MTQHTMPGEGLPQALFDVIQRLEARVETHLRGTGLHWGLRRILQQLWIRDGLSQKELAAAARITPSSCSNMLKHLIAGEWVERRRDSVDYRISRIRVAERGLELKRAIEEELAAADRSLRESLGQEDADRLGDLLARAFEALPFGTDPETREGPAGIWDRPTPPGEL